MEDILKRLIEPGEKLINDKKYKEGISYFTKLIEKYPNESSLYDRRASCYVYLENAEKAIENSTKALELDNLSLNAYFRNLRCYVFLGNIKKAKYYAERGLKASKKSSISDMNNKLFEEELNSINKLQELMDKVIFNYQRGQYNYALKYLEEAFLIADPTLEQRTKLKKGISILGNVSTNGVCKEWQLLRGKILSKCNQFFSAKKVASTMESKYSSYLHGQYFSVYIKYMYDEISLEDVMFKMKNLIERLNNCADNEVDFYDNNDIINEILDFLKSVEEIDRLKNQYNEEYKKGKYKSADSGYYKCLKISNNNEIYGISYVKLLSNLSNTKSKLDQYKLSSEYSTKGIEMLGNMIFSSNNKKLEIKIKEINKSPFKSLFTKLYMRRASSLRQQMLYEKAIFDYDFLLKLLPDDQDIKKALDDTKYDYENKNKNKNTYSNSNTNNNNNYNNYNNKSNNYNNKNSRYSYEDDFTSSSEIDQEENYYTMLGLKFVDNPNIDTIKKAFHKMALKYHPDKCLGQTESQKIDAEKRFKKINEAYSVLSNVDSKQSYDNKLKYSNFFKMYFNPKPNNVPKKKTVSTDELLDQFINEEKNKKFFFGLF